MYKVKFFQAICAVSICMAATSCKIPQIIQRTENQSVPASYNTSHDTTNMGLMPWRQFFPDQHLVQLIDTALANNQEMMITLQEIEIARNDIRSRHAALLPTVGYGAGIGVEKVGRYTSQGAGDASADITPGKEVPEMLMDHTFALRASWEADIWSKLHNAKKAAVARYLATVEGKNFVQTNLVAEVANTYFELIALDKQLDIVRQNIALQKNALDIVKVQKEAARATELAVKKFEAEVLSSQSLEFDLLQNVKETENRMNFLLGRYPQPIQRDTTNFQSWAYANIQSGIPSQLLANRPDIKQAEKELAAAKLDVKVARAEFYPSLGISSSLGLQAFNPAYLVKLPESILFSLAGDLAGPLINRNAIKAEYFNANARQLQAIYQYERTVLNAYLEVATQLSGISNLEQRYALKSKQVDALTRSIDVSTDLFTSARADYLEVLMTQRDALDTKLDLIETKKSQLNAMVTIYKQLGGGWR